MSGTLKNLIENDLQCAQRHRTEHLCPEAYFHTAAASIAVCVCVWESHTKVRLKRSPDLSKAKTTNIYVTLKSSCMVMNKSDSKSSQHKTLQALSTFDARVRVKNHRGLVCAPLESVVIFQSQCKFVTDVTHQSCYSCNIRSLALTSTLWFYLIYTKLIINE